MRRYNVGYCWLLAERAAKTGKQFLRNKNLRRVLTQNIQCKQVEWPQLKLNGSPKLDD